MYLIFVVPCSSTGISLNRWTSSLAQPHKGVTFIKLAMSQWPFCWSSVYSLIGNNFCFNVGHRHEWRHMIAVSGQVSSGWENISQFWITDLHCRWHNSTEEKVRQNANCCHVPGSRTGD